MSVEECRVALRGTLSAVSTVSPVYSRSVLSVCNPSRVCLKFFGFNDTSVLKRLPVTDVVVRDSDVKQPCGNIVEYKNRSECFEVQFLWPEVHLHYHIEVC